MATGLTSNLYLLTPEFVLTALAFLVFTVDLFLPERKKEWLAGLSVASLIAVMVVALLMRPSGSTELYGGLIVVDDFGLFFKIFFLGIGVGIIALSWEYARDRLEHRGEFYGLLLFSILGMNLLSMSRELLTAYISLELLSFSLYVMVAYGLREARSNEAGIKYIIIGALSSAIMLYGLSNIYAGVGTTTFVGIAEELSSPTAVSPVLWVGIALMVVGLGFKLSAVPFHMWAPDAYEGAPLPVAAYLAIGSKAAAFALTLRFFAEAMVPSVDLWGEWQLVIAVLAAITMLLGNLVALAQRNLKRLMAYSSIGHVGYALAGVAVLGADFELAARAVIFYLVVYAVTNLVVFAGITAYYNRTGEDDIADLAGLADRQPYVAAAIAIGLFSLAGLPIFAGFTAKFYLFAAVADGGFLWLAGVAIFTSLISLYYYLQVMRQMYIEPAPTADGSSGGVHESHQPEDHHDDQPHHDDRDAHGEPEASMVPLQRPSWLLAGTMGVGLLVVTWLGVYPAPLLRLIELASTAILPLG